MSPTRHPMQPGPPPPPAPLGKPDGLFTRAARSIGKLVPRSRLGKGVMLVAGAWILYTVLTPSETDVMLAVEQRERAEAYAASDVATREKIMACTSGKIDQGIGYFAAQKQCRDDIAPGKELLSECVEREMANGMKQIPATQKCLTP